MELLRTYGLLDHTDVGICDDKNDLGSEGGTQFDKNNRFVGDKFLHLKCQVRRKRKFPKGCDLFATKACIVFSLTVSYVKM